jgi:hypothetical protein
MPGAAHRRRSTCRVCGGRRLEVFLQLGPQPLANAYVDPARTADEPWFPLDVAVCHDCRLVQLIDVIDPELLFRDYAYRTGVSTAMDAHFRDYAKSVVEMQKLGRKDLVIEVASNDGTLLKHFRDLGVRTLGIEPARNLAAESRAAGIETLDLFFDAHAAELVRNGHGPARAVIANNVLAHVDDPVGFLSGMRLLVEGRPGEKPDADRRVWIEVPSVREMLAELEYDTIYHEHLSYFGAGTLERACGEAGLEIAAVDALAVHGGSLRLSARPERFPEPQDRTVEVPASLLRRGAEEIEAGLDQLETYRRFAERVARHRDQLVRFLRDRKKDGASIAAYGAPAKGNTLLNWCRLGPDVIDFTVDRNPSKVGKLTPGMHLPILPVETLLKRKPDFVLLLAWNLADEIMGQQREYARRGGRFILPFPSPRVIGAEGIEGTAAR